MLKTKQTKHEQQKNYFPCADLAKCAIHLHTDTVAHQVAYQPCMVIHQGGLECPVFAVTH